MSITSLLIEKYRKFRFQMRNNRRKHHKDRHERSKSVGFEHCLNYFKILEGASVQNGASEQPNVQPPPPPPSNPTSNEPKDMSSIIEKLKSNRRSSNSSRSGNKIFGKKFQKKNFQKHLKKNYRSKHILNRKSSD